MGFKLVTNVAKIYRYYNFKIGNKFGNFWNLYCPDSASLEPTYVQPGEEREGVVFGGFQMIIILSSYCHFSSLVFQHNISRQLHGDF